MKSTLLFINYMTYVYSWTQEHRSAIDCLAFTQPPTEPYEATLFYPNMPVTIQCSARTIFIPYFNSRNQLETLCYYLKHIIMKYITLKLFTNFIFDNFQWKLHLAHLHSLILCWENMFTLSDMMAKLIVPSMIPDVVQGVTINVTWNVNR